MRIRWNKQPILSVDLDISLHRVSDPFLVVADLKTIDFVPLDLWKDLYVPCLEAFRRKLSAGAITRTITSSG